MSLEEQEQQEERHQKIFLDKKNSLNQKFFSDQNFFFRPKFFSPKIFSKFVSDPKLYSKNFSDPNQNQFGSKFFLDQKFLDTKFFVDPKFFWTHDFLRTQYLFGTWTLPLETSDKAFSSWALISTVSQDPWQHWKPIFDQWDTPSGPCTNLYFCFGSSLLSYGFEFDKDQSFCYRDLLNQC